LNDGDSMKTGLPAQTREDGLGFTARIVIPFALGYFLSYLFRVINAVIATDLTDELGLSSGDLGLLTSVYFVTFALAQLPLGILLDRYGPRLTNSALLLVAGAGAVVFATAETMAGLILGRALIGLGTAGSLMAALKAYSMWFPGERVHRINGIHLTAGGLGALAGSAPVEFAVSHTDWSNVFLGLAVVAVVISVTLLRAIPEHQTDGGSETLIEQIRGIGIVFRSPLFWAVAPFAVLSQASFLGIQSLWIGPWLRDVTGLDRAELANTLAAAAVGTIIGFLIMGTLTETLVRRGVDGLYVLFGALSAFLIVQALLLIPHTPSDVALWLAFGLFGTGGILSYATLAHHFPSALTGRVITGLNVFTFAGAFAVQWGFGLIVDLWPSVEDGRFLSTGYRAALMIIVILQIVALIWYLRHVPRLVRGKGTSGSN